MGNNGSVQPDLLKNELENLADLEDNNFFQPNDQPFNFDQDNSYCIHSPKDNLDDSRLSPPTHSRKETVTSLNLNVLQTQKQDQSTFSYVVKELANH